ncbi:MAG: serine hydrolase [Bacteroidales bacterium]|nr:serine hydrolase [Bacteroidales bacterium]MDT8432665.1 serine hydrolase [Bacteroidales bacterium]
MSELSTLLIVTTLLFASCNLNKPVSPGQNSASNEELILGANSLVCDTSGVQMKEAISKIKELEYPNIHSLLISKNGVLIFEKYFEGTDYDYGRNLGRVNHTDTTLHDIRSISKSIVSACVGIAIEKGFIKNVDQRIFGFFPTYDSLFKDQKANWTIQHFLTMTTGLSWNEEISYDNPNNDELQMAFSEEPLKYIMSKPLDTIPGKQV